MIDRAMMRRLMTQCGMEDYVIDDAAMRLGKAIYEAGSKDEREACAKVCDDEADKMENGAQRAIENGEHTMA